MGRICVLITSGSRRAEKKLSRIHGFKLTNSLKTQLFTLASKNDMDIKTLLHNLREEVSCSVCTTIFTDPKQLQCLHSFCLKCLKQWHRTSHGRDTIRCPRCQALNKVPESGDLKDLPTSFYLNGLIDVLAIKECKNSQVQCGNCDKKSSETSYCFQCCIFYCQECVIGHNIMRNNNDHRVLALKDFQEKDFEDVLKRPSFCTKQRHEKEELKYFCKNCDAAVCQTCVLMDHAGHTLEHLEEEAERQKIEVKSLTEEQKRNLQAKVNTVGQLEEEYARLIQQGEDAKRNVHRFVEDVIAVIQAKRENTIAKVESQTKASLQALTAEKTETESQIKSIESTLAKTNELLTRSTDVDVVQLKKSLCAIIATKNENQPIKRDPNKFPAPVFMENRKVLDTVNCEEIGSVISAYDKTEAGMSVTEGKELSEAFVGREVEFVLVTKNAQGQQCYFKHDNVTVEIADERHLKCATDVRINNNEDGHYQISYFPRDSGRFKVTVKVNGEQTLGNPLIVQVKQFQLIPISTFGTFGLDVGMLHKPSGLAVSASDEIAVTDSLNHRVQIFNADGLFLRSFGRQGYGMGELITPKGITFHKNGNIFVADRDNHRVQIFSGEGEFLRKFGGEGSLDAQLLYPRGLSVDSDGNILVTDIGNKLIKIFSPEGKFLRKFGGHGSLNFPVHCVQYDRYLIVSDKGDHCIKVFDQNGTFQYKFGKQGEGDGEFQDPFGLFVNKSGHLMVCDARNHRVQVFELSGKFVGKFGTKGTGPGELNTPRSISVLNDGRIILCELRNNRFQLLTFGDKTPAASSRDDSV